METNLVAVYFYFLRLMIFKKTDSSLVIINKKTIETIKQSESNAMQDFLRYDEFYGYKRLAEIAKTGKAKESTRTLRF